MPTTSPRGRTWSLPAALLLLVPLAAGCALRTDAVLERYRAGASLRTSAASSADPEAGRVRQAVVGAAMGGYFGQGRAARGSSAVAPWFDRAAAETEPFVALVARLVAAQGSGGWPTTERATLRSSSEQVAAAQESFRAVAEAWAGGLEGFALCDGEGRADLARAAALADRARFVTSLLGAASATAELFAGAPLDRAAVAEGARAGLLELRDYLARRRWQRSVARPTVALVVEADPFAAPFAAGAVWLALGLVHACLEDRACREGGDPRLSLVAGSGAGAAVAAAADLFQRECAGRAPGCESELRVDALRTMATWFTCVSPRQLYCLRSSGLDRLIESRGGARGLVELDGVRRLAADAIDQASLDGLSELVLTAADLRAGTVHALSDQNPADARNPDDVRRALEAALVLPVVAAPVPSLFQGGAERAGAFVGAWNGAVAPLADLARRGAERALVVSASAGRWPLLAAPASAFDVGLRYLEVTSASPAGALADSSRAIDATRAAESQSCARLLARAGRDPVEATAICEGRWASLCAEPASSDARPLFETERSRARFTTLRIAAPPPPELAGGRGTLDPGDARRLFLAGADASRARCRELSSLLGLRLSADALARACAAVPAVQTGKCSLEPLREVRSCD